ncbi:MAG: phenylacetate--CoA ligase, partial [Hyphomicrobiales bacterium]|nr:phenylacetate--CoA ligase [Hyphomicrobiales bacterium]
DGEKGELVFTSLTKEAMPVIRYRTRDLTRLMPGTARSMRRMEKITGRSDDMMILRGVNVFPTQIEEELLKVETLAAHYQIVLRREGRLDEMEILVEARPHAASEEERVHASRRLQDSVKNFVGVTAKVTVAPPGAVERSFGKAKRVVDKRVASSE